MPFRSSVRAPLLVAIGTLAALLSAISSYRWVSLAIAIGALLMLGRLAARSAGGTGTPRTDAEASGKAVAHVATDQVQQQLRTGDARWRAIIHSAVDGIVMID